MYHSLPASVRGYTHPSRRDGLAEHHLENSQVLAQSGPNHGSDGGSTPHNESGFQPTSEVGASPTSLGEKPKSHLFKCDDCPKLKPYANKSSLTRHWQGIHEPRFACSIPVCSYTWQPSRKSNYKQHLRNTHKVKDAEIARIVEMPPILSHPTVIKSDPSSHCSPFATDASHAFPPVIPYVPVRYPQLGYSQPEVTATKHEDSSGLKHHAATHTPSKLLPREDIAMLGEYHEIHGWFPFPPVQPVGGYNTANIPPKRDAPYPRVPLSGR